MRQRTQALAARRLLAGMAVLLAAAGVVSAEEGTASPPRVARGPAAHGAARRGALPPPRVRRLKAGRPVGQTTAPPPGRRVPAGARPVGRPQPGSRALGPGDGPVRPTAPPPRPSAEPKPRPEDLLFEVDPQGGTLRPFPDGDDRIVLVMVGNPRIRGFAHRRPDGQEVDDLWIKANTVVVWIDLRRLGAFDLLAGVRSEEDSEQRIPSGEPLGRTDTSVIQEAVLGLYAEGAVELAYGDMAFRSERLYLEPPTYQALLLEPRFTGKLPTAAEGDEPKPGESASELPLHVRARQARLVAKGVAVFDEAEVSLSRADDRMALEVARLIVQEEQSSQGLPSDVEFGQVPTLMGFRSITDQRYRAESIRLRGERIPLAYWGTADFAYPFSRNFPIRFKGFSTGNRSSLGRYATVTLGGTITRNERPLFDWDLLLGGYLKRGPAVGAQVSWEQPRTLGQAAFWNVYEFGRRADGSGFVAPDPWRWRANLETRNDLTRKLQLDVEFNDFSDAGVNLEYFENDALTHKERESYGRLRWQEDFAVGTLTGKWHQRDFVTETTELPQLALWSSAIPLVVPRRKGAVGVDIVTRSQAGYLRRIYGADELLPGDVSRPDDSATRLETLTTANVGVDVGDVRVTAFAGIDAAGYLTREPDEPDASDLWRTALVTGVRAHLQLHRTWDARGGFLQLDRLRHVIDVDAGLGGRYFDPTAVAAVPRFDYTDIAREGTTAMLRVRNRVQTRGADGEIRNVLDLDLAYHHFVDDRAPYLQESPGEILAYLRARPRERLYVAGEGDWNLAIQDFDKGFLGAGVRHSDDLSAVVGLNYIRGQAVAPLIDVSWRWSQKYGVRIREQYNFKTSYNTARVVLGRYSPDHAFFFGASQRGEDVDFQFNFQTTVGRGGIEADRTFNSEPNPDPFGVFP